MRRLIVAAFISCLAFAAEAKEFIMGADYKIDLPDSCEVVNNYVIACKDQTGQEVAASFAFTPEVSKGSYHTQEELMRRALEDPRLKQKSIDAMKQRVLEQLSNYNLEPGEPVDANVMRSGQYWSVVGIVVTNDNNTDKKKWLFVIIQIWNNGYADELKALVEFTEENKTLLYKNLHSLRRR